MQLWPVWIQRLYIGEKIANADRLKVFDFRVQGLRALPLKIAAISWHPYRPYCFTNPVFVDAIEKNHIAFRGQGKR